MDIRSSVVEISLLVLDDRIRMQVRMRKPLESRGCLSGSEDESAVSFHTLCSIGVAVLQVLPLTMMEGSLTCDGTDYREKALPHSNDIFLQDSWLLKTQNQ